MIKISLKSLCLIPICFLFAFAVSCKKDDSNTNVNTASQVSATVSSGSWRVTYFLEDNIDHTPAFAGYAFTFGGSGTVTAVKGSNTVTGTWAAGNDDSKVKLILDFTETDPWEELNEDWELTTGTSTKIELKHKSGGDGSVDYLTFEKN